MTNTTSIAQSGAGSIAASGGTLLITNFSGSTTASFEELFTGTAPATASITIQGQMRGGTKDAASDTKSTVAAAIQFVTFAKVYSSFLVTASWTGGDTTTVFNINWQMSK